jgi:hypothetical protein
MLWCAGRLLSLMVMVDALVRWSFVALTRRVPVCLLEQVLLRQVFSGSNDGGARTASAHASDCSRR